MVTAAPGLDAAFHALANPTRRAVIERLRAGPATVSQLAEPFEMALPSFLQHLKVLEDGGLVRSTKRGRTRTVRIEPRRLGQAAAWLEAQRSIWTARLDQFDDYVKDMKENG